MMRDFDLRKQEIAGDNRNILLLFDNEVFFPPPPISPSVLTPFTP